jgi:putative phosphoesterase
MYQIGVISDTHNHLDSKVFELFEGVDHILHGGDIGMSALILELQSIAPVTAVLGNTDDPAIRFRETEIVELAGRKFLLHHIVDPVAPSETIKRRIARDNPDVIVFGHTHKPFQQTIAGVLYFNPGYAGKSRFGMERTVAVLHCDAESIRAEYIKL